MNKYKLPDDLLREEELKVVPIPQPDDGGAREREPGKGRCGRCSYYAGQHPIRALLSKPACAEWVPQCGKIVGRTTNTFDVCCTKEQGHGGSHISAPTSPPSEASTAEEDEAMHQRWRHHPKRVEVLDEIADAARDSFRGDPAVETTLALALGTLDLIDADSERSLEEFAPSEVSGEAIENIVVAALSAQDRFARHTEGEGEPSMRDALVVGLGMLVSDVESASSVEESRLSDVDRDLIRFAIKRIKKDAPASEGEGELDAVYAERNRCVGAIARMAQRLGWTVGLGYHTDPNWEDDWRNIVYIDTPRGQISWHFHDSEKPLFDWMPPYDGDWDGHTTDEKYERLAATAPPEPASHKAGGEPYCRLCGFDITVKDGRCATCGEDVAILAPASPTVDTSGDSEQENNDG